MVRQVAARWTLATACCAAAVLVAVLIADDRREAKPTSVFPVDLIEEGTGASGLVLQSDRRRVLGWIAGSQDMAGERVTVEIDGRTRHATVGRDNTFVWPHSVDKPTTATFRVGELSRRELLRPAENRKPVVYFVVDRPVYRPQQTLKFAGFVRHENADGSLVPVARRELEVQVSAASSKIVAGKLPVTTDEGGRFSGEYPFAGDALDDYTLSVLDCVGEATVKLAEFRKAKVRLKIDSERKDDRMTIKFQTLDFLDRPVPASRLSFQAKIVRNESSGTLAALNAADFAVQSDAGRHQLQMRGVSEDERLLMETGVLPSGTMQGEQVVGTLAAEIELSEDGRGEHELTLPDSWTKGGYRLVVDAVVKDYNGREQRATRSLSLGGKVKDCDLELHLAKEQFIKGEPVVVTVLASDEGAPVAAEAVVTAMRLSPSASHGMSPYGYGYGYGFYGHYGYYNGGFNRAVRLRRGANGRIVRPWQESVVEERTRRSLVTAAAVKRGTAKLEIHEPGAYKLVCVAKLPDGRELKNEVGCLVREQEEMPALMLRLDETQLRTGDSLEGEIHCRFSPAKVLLTVSDSAGIQFWKTYRVKRGALRVSTPLPDGLKYGCRVEVQYLEDGRTLHVAGESVRIEPIERMLDVSVKSSDTYAPGEMVELDIDVGRAEVVDLAVSVFDQSLLGVGADRSAKARDFFLADERAGTEAAWHTLDQRLQGMTIDELMNKLEAVLEEDGDDEHGQLAATLAQYRSGRRVNGWGIATALEAGGLQVLGMEPYLNSWRWEMQGLEDPGSTLVSELLRHRAQQWSLHLQPAGNVLVLRAMHPDVMGEFGQQGQMVLGFGYGRSRGARADAHFSASANGMQSFASGQALMSHVDQGPGFPASPELSESGGGVEMVRRDFSDSAMWNARLRTNTSGRATVRFKLPDSLTNWQVVVTAVSKKTHVGQATARFRTYKPVMVWPMIPRVFTEGDTVRLYASAHNRTDDAQQMTVSLKAENGSLLDPAVQTVTVPSGEQRPVYWRFQPGKHGFTSLLMSVSCPAGSDASLKRLPVVRAASEHVATASGFIKDGGVLTVPADADLSDATLEVTLVPSLLDDALQSLDYLVEYPHGCVEQTMSRFLPAIMVKKTLDRAGIRHEALEEKLPSVVSAGIKRLLQLQRDDGGWGWQAASETHEMMTPYALYGLLEAERAGYEIPKPDAMEKGMNRLKVYVDGSGQPADRVYCMYVWSLRNGLEDRHWQAIEVMFDEDHLSDYAAALSLQMAVAAGRDELAARLAERLRERAVGGPDLAYWKTAGFSRWGEDRFEITAAVLRGLVRHNPDDELIARVINFFATTKRGDRWNSTKDTAMAIYAICDYVAAQGPVAKARSLGVSVNGGAQRPVRLVPGQLLRLKLPAEQLRTGDNELRFEGQAPAAMYRAVLRYWPKHRDDKPYGVNVVVQRDLWLLDNKGTRVRALVSGDTVPPGSYIQSSVVVKHEAGEPLLYSLVESPKPSTAEIVPPQDNRFDQSRGNYALREDKTTGVVWHHENSGSQFLDRCVLHVELEGEFVIPPARFEMMYHTTTHGYTAPFVLRVARDE